MDFIIKTQEGILLNHRPKHFNLVLTSFFIAIIFILAFTPFGFIPLGIARVTTIHVPVILGSILLGPKIGALLGATFGLASLITNTLTPTLLSFAFSPLVPMPGSNSGNMAALLVCFVPRILVGIVPYFVHKYLQKFGAISFIIAGIAGSMTNTVLVLHFIYLFFRDAYSSAVNIAADVVYAAIMGIIATNGIPEAVVASLLVAALGKVLYTKIR